MNKILTYIIPAFCALTLHAQDVVIFKNGDILTGEILEKKDELVYFRSDAFASVALQQQDIAEIRTDSAKPESTVIPDGDSADSRNTDSIDLESTAGAKERKQWSGQAGLAIAMRESNSLWRSGDSVTEQTEEYETYRVYGNVHWTGKRNSLKWDWTYRYSRSDLRKNDDYLNLSQNYQHDFTKKFFATTKTIYQQDYRRGIDSEYLQSAELGINWFNRPRLQLSTSAGGSYHYYDRIQSEYSGASGKFIFDESIRWQMINSLTLFQEFTHLGNLENYHFVFTGGLENKLVRDVFLRMEYRLDRDTDIDIDDRSYYDKALLTSILYKF